MREHPEIKQEDSTEARMNGSVSQSKKFRLQPVRSGDFKWRIFFSFKKVSLAVVCWRAKRWKAVKLVRKPLW